MKGNLLEPQSDTRNVPELLEELSQALQENKVKLKQILKTLRDDAKITEEELEKVAQTNKVSVKDQFEHFDRLKSFDEKMDYLQQALEESRKRMNITLAVGQHVSSSLNKPIDEKHLHSSAGVMLGGQRNSLFAQAKTPRTSSLMTKAMKRDQEDGLNLTKRHRSR